MTAKLIAAAHALWDAWNTDTDLKMETRDGFLKMDALMNAMAEALPEESEARDPYKLAQIESFGTEHAGLRRIGEVPGLAAGYGGSLAAEGEAQPVAWYVTGTSRMQDEHEAKAEAKRIGGTAEARPIYTAPQPAIPAGYALVPVEPTSEMIEAAEDCEASWKSIWPTMLAAALQPAEREHAAEGEAKPVAAQSRFKGAEWGPCDVEHARMVIANPHEWGGYEARLLYAAPQPADREQAAQQPSQPQGEYPPLPHPFVTLKAGEWGCTVDELYFTADQMRAYLDADRAQRHAVELTDEQIEAVIRSVQTAGRSSGAMSYLRDIANAAIAADRAARGGSA